MMRIIRLSLLALLMLTSQFQLGYSQQNPPPGRVINRPQAGETETEQAGGRGWSKYSFVGDLRCTQGSLVGLQIQRGRVLNSLQIACAPVQCANGRCGWTTPTLAARRIGTATGQATSLLCGNDEVVSGFQAFAQEVEIPTQLLINAIRIRTDFVENLSIQCAKIAGAPFLQDPGLVPIRPDGRTWRPQTLTKGGPDTVRYDPYVCSDNSTAVAVSVAEGLYPNPKGKPVVQALSLFCKKSADSPNFALGMAQGLIDCATGLYQGVQLLVGGLQLGYDFYNVAYLSQKQDYIGAAEILIRDFPAIQQARQIPQLIGDAVRQEITGSVVDVSPFQMGQRIARRLCAYGLLVPPTKVAGVLRGVVTGTEVNANALQLAGRIVELAPGKRIEFGKLVGAGEYAAVYESPNLSGQLIKVIQPGRDMTRIVNDTVRGWNEMRMIPSVRTPRIIESGRGITGPAYLIVDDVRKGIFGKVELFNPKTFTREHVNAAIDLSRTLGNNGKIWADGHWGNMFWYRDSRGLLRAGPLDTDMIFRAEWWPNQRADVTGSLWYRMTQPDVNAANLLNGVAFPSSVEIMNAWAMQLQAWGRFVNR